VDNQKLKILTISKTFKNKKIENLKSKKTDKKFIVKKENYKKLCDVYTVLSLVKKNPIYVKKKNEICYKYHINKLKQTNLDIEKIAEIKEALKYKKTPDIILELNYLEAKTFQPVDIKFLHSIDITTLSKESYSKYLKTLLFAGDIKEINTACKIRFIKECDFINKFLEGKSVKEDLEISSFQNLLKNIQANLKNNYFYKAKMQIDKLQNINKESDFAKIYDILIKLKNNNEIDDDVANQELTALKYNYFTGIMKEAQKSIKLLNINKCLAKNDIQCAKDNINLLLKKYPNDFDINILAGDIYEKCKSYLANVYYHKAYLIDKKKYFYHLLKLKNYKRLINYVDELKNYPDIFSKVNLYLAKQYYNKQQYKKALEYAIKAYKYSPSKENAVLLGKIYFNLKNYKKTIQYLYGLNFDENLTYCLGYSYYKIGNIKKAKKLFDEISNTKNKRIVSKLIEFYMSVKDQKKVKELLNNL